MRTANRRSLAICAVMPGASQESWIGPHNRYVCGNDITIADYLGIAHVTLGEAAHVDYSRWPNIERWIARMKQRPSWSTVNAAFYQYLVQPLAQASFARL